MVTPYGQMVWRGVSCWGSWKEEECEEVRVKYMDGIKVTGCSRIEEVVKLADDRAAWHSIAANVNIDTVLR